MLSLAGRRIANATIDSVREIAKATLQVARGDQTLKIARLARRDELGIIVESLGAFQANIARVNFLAHHDPLTTLPNRVSFQNRIGNAVAQAARGRLSAVLCLDLDRFKAVNDGSATPPGTRCSGSSPTACASAPGRPISWSASAATSSRSFSPTRTSQAAAAARATRDRA